MSSENFALADLCSIKQGRYLAPSEMSEVQTSAMPVPVIGGNGILGYTNRTSNKHDVVLITCRGSRCGLLQWVSAPVWVSNNAIACDTGSALGNLLVRYLLGTVSFEDVITGSAQPQITMGHLSAKRFDVPPKAWWPEIVAFMSALDARIALLRETNATLEAIAQALFKSWFVDFDPVHAKSEGLAPAGMDEATAALFPDSFEESALGLVPKGWSAAVLGELLELTKGCSYKGDGLSESEGAHMFNLGCFNVHRVFATAKVKRYTGEFKPRHEVVAGDLIIANTDMTQTRDILGRPVFVPDGFSPGFISHHVFKVTVKAADPEKAEAVRIFLFFALQQDSFRDRAIGFATGTTVLALPAAAVEGSPFYLAPESLLDAFAKVIRPMLARVRENERLAASLSALRDTLLPRLISGQLRLPEAQAALESA